MRRAVLALALGAVFAASAQAQTEKRDFIVFFGFGSATVDALGQRIVEEAAAAIAAGRRAGQFSHAKVIGYADAAGSAAASQAISERRAAAVRDRLVERGVPAEAVGIEGRGREDTGAASNAGLRDQRNRRARIVLFRPGE